MVAKTKQTMKYMRDIVLIKDQPNGEQKYVMVGNSLRKVNHVASHNKRIYLSCGHSFVCYVNPNEPTPKKSICEYCMDDDGVCYL
jgi:hypothetical protein